MKTFRLLMTIIALGLFSLSCSNEELNLQTEEAALDSEAFARGGAKVDVCHFSQSDNNYEIISVSGKSLESHLNHGDVVLVDEDGDGYVTLANGCGLPVDCDDTDPTKTDNCFVIGADYQGGKIAYILQDGDPGYVAGETHGIIAAPSDQSAGAKWGCLYESISGTSTAIGTGAANTSAIVIGCAEAGIAARICDDLVLDGYDDWYLPSINELSKLYLNRVAVGGFASDFYWSSSENNFVSAWNQFFNFGNQATNFKDNPMGVRAVRAF